MANSFQINKNSDNEIKRSVCRNLSLFFSQNNQINLSQGISSSNLDYNSNVRPDTKTINKNPFLNITNYSNTNKNNNELPEQNKISIGSNNANKNDINNVLDYNIADVDRNKNPFKNVNSKFIVNNRINQENWSQKNQNVNNMLANNMCLNPKNQFNGIKENNMNPKILNNESNQNNEPIFITNNQNPSNFSFDKNTKKCHNTEFSISNNQNNLHNVLSDTEINMNFNSGGKTYSQFNKNIYDNSVNTVNDENLYLSKLSLGDFRDKKESIKNINDVCGLSYDNKLKNENLNSNFKQLINQFDSQINLTDINTYNIIDTESNELSNKIFQKNIDQEISNLYKKINHQADKFSNNVNIARNFIIDLNNGINKVIIFIFKIEHEYDKNENLVKKENDLFKILDNFLNQINDYNCECEDLNKKLLNGNISHNELEEVCSLIENHLIKINSLENTIVNFDENLMNSLEITMNNDNYEEIEIKNALNDIYDDMLYLKMLSDKFSKMRYK